MLKAGFARLDITPPLGTPLAGYQRPRFANGVLDPIEVNAVALNDGDKTLIMIAADVEGMDVADAKHIKKLIFDRTGIPAEYVVVSALHQHTTYIMKHKVLENLTPAFAEVVYTKFCDVAQMAIDDMQECELSVAEKETAEPLAFVRRYILKDGKTVTNPTPKQIPEIERRCSEADNTVRLLRFKRENAKDIALVNFSTHPDVVHGEKVSADWPGFTRRFVEADAPDVSCLVFVGAEGDSNHLDHIGGIRNGYAHSIHMGRVIADTVKEMWDNTVPKKCESISAAVQTVYNKANTEGEELYDESKAKLIARENGTLGYNPEIEEVAFARRVVAIRESMTIYHSLPITVVSLGEIVIVGLGGEPFTDYAKSVREVSGDRFAMTFALTNGHQGYLPTAAAFREGGYEAKGSKFTAGLQDQVIAAVKDIITH
jgi:hypothetical protein